MNIDPNIPYFEDKDTPVQPDKETVERKTVNAIVYDPRTDRILCLDWKEHGWKTTVIGGIENDESAEVSGMREIKEETGYFNLEFKGDVTRFYTSFYAAHKGVNRLADTTAVLFILTSDEQAEIDGNETKNHEFAWIPKAEALNYVNVEAQKYALGKALEMLS